MTVRASESLSGLPGPGLRRSLWQRYVTLLADGVPSDQVLVLVDGASRPQWTAWRTAADAPQATGGQWIETPFAWIQQELRLWWGLALEGLAGLGAPVPEAHQPVFAAIDLAQYLLGHFTAHRREAGLLERARSAPHFQSVQLLDALGRGVENGLALGEGPALPATRDRLGRPVAAPCLALAGAIAARLDAGGTALAEEAGEAIALYVDGMLRAGVLDHALQLEVFASALWPHPQYREHLKARFRHVLVEHLDEQPPRLQAVLHELLADGVQGCFSLQRDPQSELFMGGLREYVGADPRGAWEMATNLTHVVPVAEGAAPFAPLGRALLRELTSPRSTVPEAVDLPPGAVELRLDHYSPAEMLQAAAERLVALLATNTVLPRHVALISPTLSPLLIWSLRQKLGDLGVPLYVFAGTNRLRDYRPVRVLLTLAKLAHPAWGLAPTRYELLELLELCTGLNPLKLGRLAPRLFPDGKLAEPAMVLAAVPELKPAALKRYAALAGWLEQQSARLPLPTFFQSAFAHVYARARAPHGMDATADEVFMREISQIGQLIELSERFEAVDRRVEHADAAAWAQRFFAFLDDSPIAERPFFQREPHQNAVMLSTPSQLAERGFQGVDDELRCLFLLDIGSEGWWKRDRRELTNGRVLSRRWRGGPYDPDTERADMDEKLGRVLLACSLKARERLMIYGCLTDEEGRENQGELPYVLNALLAEVHG
ncbi:MAG: hypothetical protein JWM80_3611 [Cyanobacteria bacterium RYN_339]|nr:hypothetical protein [Cyanobacteria bacterium RYN_339]